MDNSLIRNKMRMLLFENVLEVGRKVEKSLGIGNVEIATVCAIRTVAGREKTETGSSTV